MPAVNKLNYLNSLNGPPVESADGAGWEDPIPFEAPFAPRPIPPSALVSPLREIVEEVAESVQVPADLVAGAVLVLPLAAVGQRVRIEVGESHPEAAALWSVGVAISGERKSAVMRHISAPIEEWEIAEADRLGLDIAAAHAAREVALARCSALTKEAAKAESSADRAALLKVLAQAKIETEVPVPSATFVLQDATPEAMVRLLSAQGGRGLFLDDEGGGFYDIFGGRYSKTGNANLDALLKAHSGSPIRVDRVSRPGEFVRRSALSICLMVQPYVLGTLSARPDFVERGVLARINFVCPPSRVGWRQFTGRPVGEQTTARYAAMLKFLLNEGRPSNDVEPRAIRLSPGALRLFGEFHDEIEVQLREGGRLRPVIGWASKAPGNAVRLATSLRLAEAARDGTFPDEVAEEDFHRAMIIHEALEEHALVASALCGGDPKHQRAKAVLSWIGRHQARIFRASDVHQSLRHMESSEITEAATLLEERHYIRRLELPTKGGPGRRPGVTWEVNPAFLASISPSDNSANSANSPQPRLDRAATQSQAGSSRDR